MSAETLFGPEPVAPPELSADQKITKRNRDMLDDGRHPATLLPLLGNGATCSTCTFHKVLPHHNRTYHKCDVHRLGITHSTASDIRLSWPACTHYEAADPGAAS